MLICASSFAVPRALYQISRTSAPFKASTTLHALPTEIGETLSVHRNLCLAVRTNHRRSLRLHLPPSSLQLRQGGFCRQTGQRINFSTLTLLRNSNNLEGTSPHRTHGLSACKHEGMQTWFRSRRRIPLSSEPELLHRFLGEDISSRFMALHIPHCGDLQSEETTDRFVTPGELKNVLGLATWLEERLPGGRVQLQAWGRTPGTKRVGNLWGELIDREILLEDANPPKRTVHVASVKIRSSDDRVLMESHQEMETGELRYRNQLLSEKMRAGEDVSEACFRGIFEELGEVLGARERVSLLPESYSMKETERESFSYPGLLTRYIVHTVCASVDGLPNEDFSTVEEEKRSLEASRDEFLKVEQDREKAERAYIKLSSGDSLAENGNVSGVGEGVERLEGAVGVKRHFWVWRKDSVVS